MNQLKGIGSANSTLALVPCTPMPIPSLYKTKSG